MFTHIEADYRTTRALQICVVFLATLALQHWVQYAHSAWIGFSVMMIYAGFDSGTSLHRTIHRFWGAMLGLLLSYFLWFIIRIHYELIFLIIPIVVFMAFFSLGKFYVSPTIFTVTLTAMGIDYYTVDQYQVSEFFFDYGRSTIIALAICVFFEFFIFKKSNLTHKFYFDLQQTLVRQLDHLYHVVTQYPIRQSQYLMLSTQLNMNILELRAFLIAVKHDYHIQAHHFDTLNTFNHLVEQANQNIRQLFVDGKQSQEQLKTETRLGLQQLFQISQEQSEGNTTCILD